MSPQNIGVAQHLDHLNAHAFDPSCGSCAHALKAFDPVVRRARPVSVGFAISVWSPVLDVERQVQTGPGWAVEWARCVEWHKAKAAFESLSAMIFITGVAQWHEMNDSERREKREVGLFLDCVSTYGHVDRFQLDIAYRKTDA